MTYCSLRALFPFRICFICFPLYFFGSSLFCADIIIKNQRGLELKVILSRENGEEPFFLTEVLPFSTKFLIYQIKFIIKLILSKNLFKTI